MYLILGATPCCDVFRYVRCFWLKFEYCQFFSATFAVFVVFFVWPGLCNDVAPDHTHFFDLQHPACHNRVAKPAEHVVANNVTICK